MINRRSLTRALMATPALSALPSFIPTASAATAWKPERPIRFVVGFAAGGSTDTSARLIANAIGTPLGQPIVVENRVGAAGNLGSENVARSAPDGYSFVVASIGTHATNQFLYPDMPFHVVRDFTPVSLVLVSGTVLVIRSGLDFKSVADLIAYAKQNPGKLNLGTGGSGSSQHFAGALFENRAGVTFTHIPYRGGAPAMADLVAGRVDVIFSPLAEAMGFIRSGKIHPLGTSRLERTPATPELPAIAETVPGYEFNSWIGLFGPAKLPEPIVTRMSDEIAKAVATPETRQRMEELGYIPAGGDAKAMAEVQARDVKLMEELARLTGLYKG